MRISGVGLGLVLFWSARAQTGYIITTLAGGAATPTPVAAVNAAVRGTDSVALDAAGNVYFVDDNCVFKVDSTGVLTRIAGKSTVDGYGGDGGLATGAQFAIVSGVAVDKGGNIYIADYLNNRVRKVAANGIITNVAGNSYPGNYGDGGPANSASLQQPLSVAIDSAGNLYIADGVGSRIRKVARNGIITTVAGNGNFGYSGDGGLATNAEINRSEGVAVDAAGALYIADTENHRIRKVAPNGIITTVAGNGTQGYAADGGPATGAELSYPAAVAVDAAGNLYIADNGNGRIRRVANGIITTVAGNGSGGYSGDGGLAISAGLGGPSSVAVDGAGNIYISDSFRIRKIAGGVITTLAGNGAGPVAGDGGTATGAEFNVAAVAADGAGNTYIADSGSNRVRKVAANGTVSTVAGNGFYGYAGDGGPATSAMLAGPNGVAVDAHGNLYIADYENARVRRVTTDGTISTVAGNGSFGSRGDGGLATSADVAPYGIAVDASGNLLIADAYNNRIRKVTVATGIISTVAGNGIPGYAGDGGAATNASLNWPQAVAADLTGNVYIADTDNACVRKVAVATGIITTVAGNGIAGYSGDGGPAKSAQLVNPWGVAVDSSGNLYLSDTVNYRVRRVSPNGTISTIAGNGDVGDASEGDGGPATSAMVYPEAIAVDSGGRIYVTEYDRVRVLSPQATSAVLTVASLHTANFWWGQTGATYLLVVGNILGAQASSGTVVVTEYVPAGLTLVSMSGIGWNCSANTCTRSDSLGAGVSFPPITVTVNVATNAPVQVLNQVTATGGNSAFASDTDLTTIVALPNPVLSALGDGATGVTTAPVLSWNAVAGATSYDVWFGPAGAPLLVANVVGTSYAPGTLNGNTTYVWWVVARGAAGTASSAAWSFTTLAAGKLARIDLAVWRPANGTWYVDPATGSWAAQQWGLSGDVPVAGNFGGDGRLDAVVWRPAEGNWYLNLFGGTFVRQWGLAGDKPVPGDYDGDGKTDYAVWRPGNGTWYITLSSNGSQVVKQWGLAGDIPVVADFDGDGKADFVVWRPADGMWYITLSSNGQQVVKQWGLSGDKPVAADFDHDGKADYAIWRPAEGNWYVTLSSNGQQVVTQWGLNGDIPVPRDYDGDGKADYAVWRPGNGTWYITPSSNPAAPIVVQWGLSGDVPIYKPAGN